MLSLWTCIKFLDTEKRHFYNNAIDEFDDVVTQGIYEAFYHQRKLLCS